MTIKTKELKEKHSNSQLKVVSGDDGNLQVKLVGELDEVIRTTDDLKKLSKEDYLSIEEVAIRLDKSNEYVRKIIGNKYKMQEVKAGRGTTKRKVIKFNDFLALQQKQLELERQQDIEKSVSITNKFTDDQVLLAFGKSLEEKSPREILQFSLQALQLSLKKSDDLSNEKDKTISILNEKVSILDEKVSSLEVEVGKSKEYYSIKKVAIINSKKEKDYKWRLLKKNSVVLGKEIKTERDNNYGNVNSYHIDVWKKVYPGENY
jgi:hypothetical protein